MQSVWIEPAKIEDVWSVNNRKENAGHIESLAESMRNNGYLPEYPVIVFKSDGLGIMTDKEFVMACGHHRRKAAIEAGIYLIFAEVHEGTEEDWIELMSTDNFQFDVASNPGIGLAFTEQERRAACQQLLLLPKYLRKTNTTLAAEWKVSEGTIRRWRASVETLINERSPMLDEFSVSRDRRKRLREVIADPYRENGDGETVAVRQKPQEATAEERAKLWYDIRATCLFKKRSDGKTYIERHGFYMESLLTFICEKFNIQENGIPHQLSRNNLKMIHKWILTEAPAVIERCQWIQRDKDAASKVRQDLYETYQALETAFTQKLSPTPGNSMSTAHVACFKQFGKNVKIEYDFKLDDRHKASTFEEILQVVQILKNIISDIEFDAQWVVYFREEHTQKMAAERQQLETQWLEKRQAMFLAVTGYPRNITKETFAAHLDSRYNLVVRTTLEKTKPAPADSTEQLQRELDRFINARKDIIKDRDWVQEIPEAKTLIESLGLTNQITGLTISAIDRQGNHLHVDLTEDEINVFIPDELRSELFKVAEKHGYE